MNGETTRQAGGVAFAGRAGWHRTQPTVAELAADVKRYVWDNVLSHSLAAGADPDRQALALISGRFPSAEATFGRVALLALTRPGGACYWCRTWLVAGADPEQLPHSHSRPVWELLGRPCKPCFDQMRLRHWRQPPAVRAAAVDAWRQGEYR